MHEKVNCPSFASTVKLFSSPTISYKFIPDVFKCLVGYCQGLMHVEKLLISYGILIYFGKPHAEVQMWDVEVKIENS